MGMSFINNSGKAVKMKGEKIDFNQSALIVVDMQKVYLYGSNFKTFDWQKIVANIKVLLDRCRSKNIPVVFIRMWYRPDGSDAHQRFPRNQNGSPVYAVAGVSETEIHDDLKPKDNEIIINKQRMSGFFQTNLDLTLQGLKVNHLIITGVSSDACVLTTVHDAYFRNYEITVVKDACGTETSAAHMTSILNIANWVYGSSIFETDELLKAMKGEEFNAWFWERPGAFMYSIDTIKEMYDQI